jgi:hypothetical protein
VKIKTRLLTFIVALLAISLVGACAGPKAKDDSQAQEKRLPAYFEEIPADTFFFAGGSQPVPRELVAKSLSTLNTMYDWSTALEGTESFVDNDPRIEAQTSQATDAAPDLFELVVEQMGDELSAEGLEKLGISASPRVASYSVGTVPVLRIELSDQTKFLTFLDRLEETYDRPSTKLEHKGTSYRRFEHQNTSQYALLRTTQSEAILALPEKKVFEIFVPYFVGAKKPAKSLADDNAFLRTVETHGFKRFGAAYVDLEQVLAYSTGTKKPAGITAKILAQSDFMMTSSDQCKKEYMRLVKKMPRLVAGFRHFDATTTDVAFGAEFEDSFARGLAATVSGTPGHDTAFANKSLVELGLGINLDKMTKFLVEQAREVQMQPFQCEEFADLNRSANNLIGGSAQIPPAISELAGFNLLVRNVVLEWKPGANQSGTTLFIPRMVAALRTDQPEAFMFLVKQFFPMAKQIQATPDGNPVPIPQASGVYEGIVEPALLMTKRGLAVTVGPNMTEDTRTILDAEESATSPAFVSRLNLGDPARDLLASMQAIVDKAGANKDARGLTDADLAGARRAMTVIENFLPADDWTATFTTEFNDFGILLSYRDQGALNFDPDQLPGDEAQADFDALERVLGLDSKPAPVAAPVEGKPTGFSGTGQGGGGMK